MKKNSTSHNTNIPDLEIIDLESSDLNGNEDFTPDSDSSNMDDFEQPDGEEIEYDEEDFEEYSSPKTGLRRFLNMHTAFVAILLIVLGICIFRFKNWGVRVDLDEIFKDGQGTYEDDFDQVLPLLDANSQPIYTEGASTIVVFGNAPFADDRDSEDNLANLIEEMTGATVYNCSISNSYMACQRAKFSRSKAPMDAYCFYWLACVASGLDMTDVYEPTRRTLIEAGTYPEEADEVYEILTTLDFNTVDTIAIMYDATDYLMGSNMYNDGNPTDITCFSGNMEAGIELLQSTYPHIRFIVMSPTYAYAVDEAGNYISSDQYTYGEQDVLSTYVIKQCESALNRSVSFVDHLYGSITENNAKDYLTDNLHLNLKGRKLVAERFEYFLNYYKNGYGVSE